MTTSFAPDEAGYVLYQEMVTRLANRFPTVPLWRIEEIAYSENEAMTGGLLRVVPSAVEDGTAERLAREALAKEAK